MIVTRYLSMAALALAMAGLSLAATAQELVEEGSKPPAVVGSTAAGTETVGTEPTGADTAGASPVLQEGAKDPASGIAMRGLMWMLSSTMRGHRVIAAGDPNRFRSVDLNATDYKHARTVIEKLQAIAATQSDDEHPNSPWSQVLIPFKVGSSYAIAPETREGVNVDLRGLSAVDVTARGTLLMDVLLHLTPKQLAAVGSEGGLAVSSLPRETQALLMRSFRPPLKIIEVKPSTYTDEHGMVRPSRSHNEIARLDEPIDWSQVHIRAHLRLHGANLQLGRTGTMIGNRANDEGLMFEPVDGRYQPWSERGAELPIYQEVPNTYKPSDLDGRRYVRPFGLSGVWKVEDVVQRLSRNTGLKMKVWQLYKDRQVFIGAPDVTDGEVMDALRLCLTASWRRLGDTYLLAWDRMPLQAIQLMARETSQTAARQVRKRRAEMESDPGMIQIVRLLPFSHDDPLALTAEQRTRLFPTEPAKKGPGYRGTSLPFTEMTPDQQAHLRRLAESQAIDLPDMGPESPAVKRPYTDDDIRNLTLQPQGNVVVSISVPGRGWVRAAENWDALGFNGWQLQRAVDKLASGNEKRDILDEAPPEVREMLANMKPMPLPSANRAVIVPVLGPARLNELADEMKRHGLNTLFYPALFGGYATFPSKAFPLHPALRGEDGFAAAVSAMKPKGIKVVGYLNTLAWQNASDKVHWLSKYPQWQDVDVLGRTRLQWAAQHPEALVTMSGIGYSVAGYVRPTEPMVEARLKALIAEFAAKRDVAGVAFAEMAPAAIQQFMPGRLTAPPPLGFSLADRLSIFEKTGHDPADSATWNDYMPPSLRHQPGLMGSEGPDLTETHNALAARLIADAKARRKDWTTYTLNEAPARGMGRPNEPKPGAVTPKPDLGIRSIFQFMDDQNDNSGLLFPISSRNFFASLMEMEEGMVSEMIPESLLKLPSLAVYNLIWNTEARMKSRTLPLVALDFRTAPETISETLKWVEAPGAATTAVKTVPTPPAVGLEVKPSSRPPAQPAHPAR